MEAQGHEKKGITSKKQENGPVQEQANDVIKQNSHGFKKLEEDAKGSISESEREVGGKTEVCEDNEVADDKKINQGGTGTPRSGLGTGTGGL